MDSFMETPVGHDDFNRINDIAIFQGPVEGLYEAITKDDLRALIDSGAGFTLIDVSESANYLKSHICGALDIPVDLLERDALGLERSGLVVVYAHAKGSLESAVAADKLYTIGFKRVLRYIGGLDEWKASGLCVESGARAGAAPALPEKARKAS